MVRSRRAAAALTATGHVRLNGHRLLSPGRLVRAGDVVTVALDRAVRVLRVEGFSERRGNATAGRALYRDLTTASGGGASASDATSRNIAS